VRICFVNTQKRWAGGERWFLWAAEAAAKRGHDVVLVASGDSELAERASSAGVSVETAGRMPGRLLRKLFGRQDTDAVLCNSGGEARSCVRARGGSDRPKVILRRGLCKPLGSGPVKTSFYRRMDGVFCNSRRTADLLRESHPWLQGREMAVLYNPVPPLAPPDPGGTDRLRSELSISPGDFVVLSVGRLDPDKGHVFLVRAFAGLRESFPNARLVIAGEGPERAALEGEMSGSDRAALAGFVDDPAALYAIADVMVMPSLPGYESFSNAALEAMSFGLPLIATTCGGFPELVTDGENGILVEPGDADGIEAGLKKLAGDGDLREKLGTAGKETALDRFAPEKKAAELETYLENMLEG
jgi:glycosyltransferase involved in cell wall biosynthesis